MKARRKGTNGEWQEVQSVILADNEWTIIKAESIEFQHDNLSTEIKTYAPVDEEKHWQDVRERAAIAAMQGILSNAGFVDGQYEYRISVEKASLSYADELVKILNDGEAEISK